MENDQILTCEKCGTKYLKKCEYIHKYQECDGKKKKTIFDNMKLDRIISEDTAYALNLQNQFDSGIMNQNNNHEIPSEDTIMAINLHNQLNNNISNNNNNKDGNIHSEDSIFAMNLQNQYFSEPSCNILFNNNNNNNNNNRNNPNLKPIEEEVSEVSQSLSNLNINEQRNNNNNDNSFNIINNEEEEEKKEEESENPGSRRIVFRLSGLAMLGVLINFLEHIENESNQVDEKLLKRIPIIEVEDKNKLSDDNKKCTICQDEYNNKDKVIVLPCLHVFHPDCINNWFSSKNTCPNCKFLLTKSNLYNQEGYEETPEESLRNMSQIKK